MDDLISRQAAIDACYNSGDGTGAYAYGFKVEERLQNLPSVQPAPREGRWIFEVLDGVPGYRPTVMFCSKCGRMSIADYSYCPNCGAKMKEEK